MKLPSLDERSKVLRLVLQTAYRPLLERRFNREQCRQPEKHIVELIQEVGDSFDVRIDAEANELLPCAALVLVRDLFGRGYTCALDDARWIDVPADPTLQRLWYIRSWGDKSTSAPEWMSLQADYFDWALFALDRLLV